MDNSGLMRLAFTKMQGAGNDFVVIDATRAPVSLSASQIRRLADRRFGVGADQVLFVEPADGPDVDFVYRIFNADGQEVEQCGNGARCFARFVHDRGLSSASTIFVRTKAGVISPSLNSDGSVTVDMGAPRFSPHDVAFDAAGLPHRQEGGADFWELSPETDSPFWLTVVSMGNPHAVQWVKSLQSHPVQAIGAWCESHPRFADRVNVGFVEQHSSTDISLRVYERGAGETLACGTGACAAVAAGIRRGVLSSGVRIQVRLPGGTLGIEWSGKESDPVMMTGPAEPVYEGVIEL
jgi:diaminopimelate epimerase